MYAYGSSEYIAYTSEFEYEVFEDQYNHVGEDDLHNCIRYRVIEDENYFIDEYEDGCVYAVKVSSIDNFNIHEYTHRVLLGAKGIEHHPMKVFFRIKK